MRGWMKTTKPPIDNKWTMEGQEYKQEHKMHSQQIEAAAEMWLDHLSHLLALISMTEIPVQGQARCRIRFWSRRRNATGYAVSAHNVAHTGGKEQTGCVVTFKRSWELEINQWRSIRLTILLTCWMIVTIVLQTQTWLINSLDTS